MLNSKGTLVGGTHNLPASESLEGGNQAGKQLGQFRLCHSGGKNMKGPLEPRLANQGRLPGRNTI